MPHPMSSGSPTWPIGCSEPRSLRNAAAPPGSSLPSFSTSGVQMKPGCTKFTRILFRLTEKEARSLTSQFARSNKGRGGRRTPPYAFTEQGVAMLPSVLRSTFDASQHGVLEVDLSRSADRGVELRKTLSWRECL